MHNRIFSQSPQFLTHLNIDRPSKPCWLTRCNKSCRSPADKFLAASHSQLATLRLNLLSVPGSPACIKRWRFLARFLSSFAAFRTCRFKSERRWRRSAISWCSKAWPAHESRAMLKMLVSCASPHRNNMHLLHIRADTFCDFIPNSFEPRQRYASVRNSPNLLCAAAPLSSPENTIKIVHFDPVLPDTSREPRFYTSHK